jgi:hypothetical protein
VFISQVDMRKIAVVFAHQLDVLYGPRVPKPWLDTVDHKITSLRVPGANKMEECWHCKPAPDLQQKVATQGANGHEDQTPRQGSRKKKRVPTNKGSNYTNKPSGGKRALGRLACRFCGGSGSLDVGRPYLPVLFIDSQGNEDGRKFPVWLCDNLDKVLEMARFKHYPGLDPEPVSVRIPEDWLRNPEHVRYVQVLHELSSWTNSKQGKKKPEGWRTACIPVEGRTVTYRNKVQVAILSRRVWHQMDEWLNSLEGDPTWAAAGIADIYFLNPDPQDWVAGVMLDLNHDEHYCRRKEGSHESKIWFVLKRWELQGAQSFSQFCFPCKGSPAGHCVDTSNMLLLAFDHAAQVTKSARFKLAEAQLANNKGDTKDKKEKRDKKADKKHKNAVAAKLLPPKDRKPSKESDKALYQEQVTNDHTAGETDDFEKVSKHPSLQDEAQESDVEKPVRFIKAKRSLTLSGSSTSLASPRVKKRARFTEVNHVFGAPILCGRVKRTTDF